MSKISDEALSEQIKQYEAANDDDLDTTIELLKELQERRKVDTAHDRSFIRVSIENGNLREVIELYERCLREYAMPRRAFGPDLAIDTLDAGRELMSEL